MARGVSRQIGFAALAGLIGAACSVPRSGDVILISIDTLRADHLGIYGYPRRTSPRIDRFFEDGAIFERAYATAANTPPSVVSLLSGRLPQDHGVRLFIQLLPERTRLLPDLLPETYQSAAFVSNSVLTDEAIGMAHRFEHYDDLVDAPESARRFFERNARKTTDAALRWLENGRDPERRLFLWVHYIDPHGPYRPPDDATVRFDHPGSLPLAPQRIEKYQRLVGSDDALDYVDAYDAEIAYVDAQVGRLLEGYARRAPIGAALVVLTADHGETLTEHELWFNHGYHVYEEIVRVPLLLRGPGVEGARHPAPVSGVDLAPTILRFAGVDPGGALPGRDLRSSWAPDAERVVFSEASSDTHWRAAIQGDEKWILAIEPGRREPRGVSFYDLARDPRERRPERWREVGPAAEALLALSRADPDPGGRPAEVHRGVQLRGPKVAPRADAEALEALRALGYVE